MACYGNPDGAAAPRVLVVDDEAKFARRLAREFEDAGFVAEAAHDGEQALAAVERGLPDLIVLDVRMPRMDGLECLQRLHAEHGAETPPVILLTGDFSPRVDAAARDHPGSFVLSKPCGYSTVIRVALRLLAFV